MAVKSITMDERGVACYTHNFCRLASKCAFRKASKSQHSKLCASKHKFRCVGGSDGDGWWWVLFVVAACYTNAQHANKSNQPTKYLVETFVNGIWVCERYMLCASARALGILCITVDVYANTSFAQAKVENILFYC